MKERPQLTVATCLAYCADRDASKAIDHLKEQAMVVHEEQEEDRHILLSSHESRGEIICTERLGGLLKSCHRKAA